MKRVLDLLLDAPTLKIAHERLALAREEIARLEKEVERLTKENLSLWQRVGATTSPSFIEEAGVLWKRSGSGKVSEIAYCPECELALAAFPPGSNEMLLCSKCNFTAPFRPAEISRHVPG